VTACLAHQQVGATMYLLDLFHRTFVSTVKDEGVDLAGTSVRRSGALIVFLREVNDLLPVTDQFAVPVDGQH